MSDLHCPCCGTALDLAVIFSSEADHQALARLINVGIPLGGKVIDYLTLHTPAHQRLTAAKKIKLITQLLPDLERQAITAKGRDWAVPHALWAQAIEQMVTHRERLTLPLKGHGYLYSVLVNMADKSEASTEAKAEHDRRITPERPPVTVRNAGATSIGAALAHIAETPAMRALRERDAKAVPPSAEVLAKMAALRRGTTFPPITGEPS